MSKYELITPLESKIMISDLTNITLEFAVHIQPICRPDGYYKYTKYELQTPRIQLVKSEILIFDSRVV